MMRQFMVFSSLLVCVLFLSAGVSGRAMFDNQQTATTLDKTTDGIFVPPVDFVVMRTGEIATTISNRGVFGTGFVNFPICDGKICPSFMSPEDSHKEYLFAGSIWIGGIVGTDTLVSVGADGWFYSQEFIPTVPSAHFGGTSDRSAWQLFYDTSLIYTNDDPFDGIHRPMNLRVANRVHSWMSYPENQIIIYDMVITNIGITTIYDGYIGNYIDADVYHYVNISQGFQDDLTGALRDAGVAYAIDNDGDPTGGVFDDESPTRLFAYKPLLANFTMVDTSYDWWMSNGVGTLDYGPQPVDEFGNPQCDFGGDHTGTPTGDANKYCVMSHPGWDFDQIYIGDSVPGWTYPNYEDQGPDFADGFDTRFLMSVGAFDLMPDSSIRIVLAMFTGESVHHVPDNIVNLPDDPDTYLANLNFAHVLSNAEVADSIAEELRNPMNPAMGLYVKHNNLDSTILEWDPWGFSEVEGYNIYLYKIPEDSMPYPGVAPPWITPTQADFVAEVNQVYQYNLDALEPYEIYIAAVANRTTTRAIGIFSEPITVQPRGRPPAPAVETEIIAIQPGDPAVLRWMPPEGIDVDHYNIYKFNTLAEAGHKYYRHYDTISTIDGASARDSFFVGGEWFYYYALQPYNQIEAGITGFTEYTEDSVVYVVTAVMPSGMESAFSSDVIVLEAPAQTKDIIVMVCKTRDELFHCESVTDYYNNVLIGYDYDIIVWKDTLMSSDCPIDLWQYLMPYRMAIIDGGWRRDILDDFAPSLCGTLLHFQRYVWAGGVLAYFGSFLRFTEIDLYGYSLAYHQVMNNSIIDGFGVDSVFQTSPSYYHVFPDDVDTLGGFIRAEHIFDPTFDLHFDSTIPHDPLDYWPDSVGPMASAFVPNENAEQIYTYRSLYPGSSLAEGRPVGVVSNVYPSPIYSFGFRPWYMNQGDIRNLIDYLMTQTGEYAVASAVIEPDTMYFLWAYALDPGEAKLYVGNFLGEYSADDMDMGSIQTNGGVIPTDITVIDSHPGFEGAVVELTVSMPEFLLSYGPLWDRKVHPFVISALMTNGAELTAAGDVFIKGILSGDINSDYRVNVGDVVALLQYLFSGGSAPDAAIVADVNADCVVNISDATYIVNYLFRGGPQLQAGCAE